MSEKLPQPEEGPMSDERYNLIFKTIEGWAYDLADQPGETRPGNFLARIIECTIENSFGPVAETDEQDFDSALLDKFIIDTGINLSELQQYIKKTNVIIEKLDVSAKRAEKYKNN